MVTQLYAKVKADGPAFPVTSAGQDFTKKEFRLVRRGTEDEILNNALLECDERDAEVVEVVEPEGDELPEAEVGTFDVLTDDDLRDLTKEELQNLAVERGLQPDYRLTKAELKTLLLSKDPVVPSE